MNHGELCVLVYNVMESFKDRPELVLNMTFNLDLSVTSQLN